MSALDSKVVRGTMVSAVVLLAPAAIAAYAWTGWPGIAGATMGIALGCLSIVSFGLLASLMSPYAVKRSTPSTVLLLWLIKLPLIWLVVAAVVRMGSGTTTCFLVALGLVYFALVHRAMLSAKA